MWGSSVLVDPVTGLHTRPGHSEFAQLAGPHEGVPADRGTADVLLGELRAYGLDDTSTVEVALHDHAEQHHRGEQRRVLLYHQARDQQRDEHDDGQRHEQAEYVAS